MLQFLCFIVGVVCISVFDDSCIGIDLIYKSFDVLVEFEMGLLLNCLELCGIGVLLKELVLQIISICWDVGVLFLVYE